MTRRHDGTSHVSRREFLTLGAASLLAFSGNVPSWRRASFQGPDSLPGTGPAGRLWDPSRAGRPLPPVTAADNDAALQAIEKQLHCTCGCNQDVYTCRTTDFTCTTSPAMHRRVVALAERGMTSQQILDEFVRENGVAILMAPPKRGLALVSYVVPFVIAAFAAGALTFVIHRWVQRPSRAPVPEPRIADTGATPEELERLRHELDHLSA